VYILLKLLWLIYCYLVSAGHLLCFIIIPVSISLMLYWWCVLLSNFLAFIVLTEECEGLHLQSRTFLSIYDHIMMWIAIELGLEFCEVASCVFCLFVELFILWLYCPSDWLSWKRPPELYSVYRKKETKMFLVISSIKLGQFWWNLVRRFWNKFASK